MIEITPVMLFILGWHPDRPGDISLERPAMLFETIEQCEDAGAKMAGLMTESAQDKSGAHYEHRCITVPARGEFDGMFEQLKKQRS